MCSCKQDLCPPQEGKKCRHVQGGTEEDEGVLRFGHRVEAKMEGWILHRYSWRRDVRRDAVESRLKLSLWHVHVQSAHMNALRICVEIARFCQRVPLQKHCIEPFRFSLISTSNSCIATGTPNAIDPVAENVLNSIDCHNHHAPIRAASPQLPLAAALIPTPATISFFGSRRRDSVWPQLVALHLEDVGVSAPLSPKQLDQPKNVPCPVTMQTHMACP
jgi:hypothetical protein